MSNVMTVIRTTQMVAQIRVSSMLDTLAKDLLLYVDLTVGMGCLKLLKKLVTTTILLREMAAQTVSWTLALYALDKLL